MMNDTLFDIQVNGFAGIDFQRPRLSQADLLQAVTGLRQHGTHRFFLTLITDAIESLEEKFAHIESLREQDPVLAEAICGYHLEGPWLSAEDGFRGAHDRQYIQPPDLHSFERLQKAAGNHIRLVTLAPEWPGSSKFIRELVARGVQVSLGHTNADEKEIDAAIEAGARFCTHLGNGVPLQMHRHDNIIQRLLARDELTAFFIPDGIHLPPAVLRNFFRAKPLGRALFTTDCMAAAGAPAGIYPFGSMELQVGEDRVVRQPGGGGFAGSALSMDEGVANVANWLGLEKDAVRPLFSTEVVKAFE